MSAAPALLRRDPGTARSFAESLQNRPYPKQVVFETTAFCNLKCPMCSQPTMVREQGKMDFRLFQKVIDEMAAWKSAELEIWFAVHGEALLLGPRLKRFIDYAWEKTHAKLCLNTNGVPLHARNADWLVRSPLNEIIVSIDGHSPETYEPARLGAKYSRVKANTLHLLSRLAVTPEPKPKPVVQMVLMPANLHEKEEFRKYWTEQGAAVKFKPYLEWAGACKTEHPIMPPPDRFPCQWIMNSIHILWDGRVPQCGPDTECEEEKGNVSTQSLLQIWQTRHHALRQTHLDRRWSDLPAICRRCNDWAAGPAEWIQTP